MSLKDPNLEWLVRSLRPRSVAVVGDVMLDRYVRGQVRRISPEAPIQVLEAAEESMLPGGAANVATKAAELEARVRLVGLVGDDAPAADLRGLLAARPGLEDGLVTDPSRSTTVKTRFIAHNQQLLRVDRERRTAPEGEALERLVEAAFHAARWADAVILEDYGKGVLGPEVIKAALEGAKHSGAAVVVDPNGRDYRRYAGATILTPNLRETEVAAERSIHGETDLAAAAALLVEQTGAALAVTRESEGISLFRKQGGSITHVHIPTVPVVVYDVTGAGDAVAASLAIALACGIGTADACALANLAGRAVVRQFGVGTISIGHLLDELAEVAHKGSAKVVDLPRAVERAREVRQGGGKIVFTNGCFDILHFGHAHLLQYARAQGDFLVLGLNTDDSVRRFKGADRPFVDEGQRSYMLSLYPFIDMIVLFDDDTPMRLIEAIRPDVLVKGGDYTPETVVGSDLLASYGGRVAICPRLEGLSTTDLVKKIQERTDEPRKPSTAG
jgi:D-beta-D-heptose 7-phosphate kinase / D-beta-D-heptose 1-phosphate adenosyltransferase